MLFNSLHFVVFFILFVVFFYALPHKYRMALLLISNYYFYMCWKVSYVLLLIVTTLVDYACARAMDNYTDDRIRRRFVYISLLQNLGVLFLFKYFNFFMGTARAVLEVTNIPIDLPHLRVILPVAISFYTFQSIAYVLDVYWRKVPAQRKLGYFMLYTSFFPQLVAGPIERAHRFMPQFFKNHTFDAVRVASGLRLMLWGFFKKLVVADRLCIYVDSVYNNPGMHNGTTLLVATLFFSFQIYCDFSGYTDIAIGAARILDFDLIRNFERPYFSRSIPEFWRRWHISLSTWFRDYVYIPLGGNRVSVPRAYLNLFIVFLVSGLWHGANWTFIIWGGLHGLYAVASKFTKDVRDKIAQWLRVPGLVRHGWAILFTFALASFSWIFFRANDLQSAMLIVTRIFSGDFGPLFIPAADQFVYGLAAIFMLLAVDIFHENRSIAAWLDSKPLPLRWAAYASVVVVILLMGIFNGSQFIYFQF